MLYQCNLVKLVFKTKYVILLCFQLTKPNISTIEGAAGWKNKSTEQNFGIHLIYILIISNESGLLL